MNMYANIKKIIPVIFIGTLLLSSCDSYLDVPVTSELEDSYYNTETRIDRGIGTCYGVLQTLYGANLGSGLTSNAGATLHPAWLLEGDDLTMNSTGNSQYEAFSGLAPSDGNISEIWEKFYFIVNRTTFMLDMLSNPNVVEVYTTSGKYDANRGEALFLRSWAYFRLWDLFRKAPAVSQRFVSVDNAVAPPTKNFELLDSAIYDLTQAAELLPLSWNDLNKGRVFKNSALGLLVKCYVYRACYANQYGGNAVQDYANAISAFEKMTGESTIEGVSFGQNFDYRYENNAESLFEYQASFAQKEDNAWLDNNFGWESGGMGVMYHYFDTHWGNYGSGGGIIGPTDKVINFFDPDDPRRDETFKLAENVDNLGGKLYWLGSAWAYFHGYQFVKYINGVRGDIYEVNWQLQSGNNPRLLRLADVKLAVAEAYLQSGNVTEATKQVNDIRRRARFSTPDGTESQVPADYVTPVTMQNIMDERLLELAGEEGFRWSDLKRWYASGYINLANWTAADFSYPFDANLFRFDVSRHLLFPIPTSEMNSNPLMKADGNNPGYN